MQSQVPDVSLGRHEAAHTRKQMGTIQVTWRYMSLATQADLMLH